MSRVVLRPCACFVLLIWPQCEKIAPTSSICLGPVPVDRAQGENALGVGQCHLHHDQLLVFLLSLPLCCTLLLPLFFLFCGGDEGVQGVLTLFCSGAAQVCHDDRVVELKEQLEVEEEDGDRQEEKEDVERERRVKEIAP